MVLGRCLLAGAACGALMGVLFLGVGLVTLAQNPPAMVWLAARIAEGDRPLGVRVLLIAMGAVLAWVTLGLLLGLVLFLLAQAFPVAGLGSPNAPFTIGSLVVAAVIAISTAIWKRSLAVAVSALGTGFALVFGWLMPWLAQ